MRRLCTTHAFLSIAPCIRKSSAHSIAYTHLYISELRCTAIESIAQKNRLHLLRLKITNLNQGVANLDTCKL